MHLSTHHIKKKIIGLLISISIILCIIITRLIHLQIYRSDHFYVRSQKNFLRHEIIDSPRGNIRDQNGILLATNRPITLLYWQGSGKKSLSHEHIKILYTIENILELPLTSGTIFEQIIHAERHHQKILLASDIPFEALSKLVELFADHENIKIDTHFKRLYPYQTYASHIIGYLGNIAASANGKMGLEMLFDTNLRGKQGTKQNIVNSVGKRIHETELEKSSCGNDIQTTLNIDMQTICETVFPLHLAGCFILFNPIDGAIISLVSRPNFDPNIFLNPISQDTWKTLQANNPFLNRAFSACYPPGSIFKLVTLSAALEHNFITQDETWTCKGYFFLGNQKYWCNRRWGHGELTTIQAVAQSCNILFYEIGKQIDIDLLTHYAFKFGLGQKTNNTFPEKIGLIPSRQWKLKHKGERWWQGETTSVAIGQSFLLATPIQVARMIASIFTGYLVSPRLLIDEQITIHPLEISETTREFLKESMKSVVTRGTGRRVSTVKDIEMYAKTSTAQTSSWKKRSLDPSYLEHGWFVGHFQYKDHNPLVIVILVEHVGTAQVATTIAKNFLIQYKKYMDSK